MIHVTCAIIEREGLVLAAQRSEAMRHPLQWEFPGGKLEPGESLEECIVREIREELDLEVRVIGALPAQTHINPKGMEVRLHPFRCIITGGELLPKEHAGVQWLQPRDLSALNWVAADVPVLETYLNLCK